MSKVWVLVYSTVGASAPRIRVYRETRPPSLALIRDFLIECLVVGGRANEMADEVGEFGETKSFKYERLSLKLEDLY